MEDAHTPSAGEHVDDCILEERDKDENEAHRHPHVDRFDVGDSRQGGVDTRRLRRRR